MLYIFNKKMNFQKATRSPKVSILEKTRKMTPHFGHQICEKF